MDLDLLALIKDKETFQRFKPYIKEHVLSKETVLIVNTIESFFKAYPSVKELNWEAFETYFFVLRNAQVRREAAPNYKTIFSKLKSYTPTETSENVLRQLVTDDYSTRIADTALRVREGSATIDDVGALVAKHDKELGRAINPTDLFVTGGVGSVLARAASPGFEWRLEELNQMLGPLRKGDFVGIAAYVGTGKTTLAASEVSHMATQITDSRPVVWVNNEEESSKVTLRIMQSALGLTLPALQADLPAAEAAYTKLMGMKDRILVTLNDPSGCTADKLTSLFHDLNPALIVFDQLDKVKGFYGRDVEEYARLGFLWKWARELAHTYCPVIALTQCDTTAEGEQYIRMNQLRGSKVDKPAELDALVTIGKSHNPAAKHQRFIHVPKNKLFGGGRMVEAEREGYCEVEIKPEIARYEGSK